MIMICVPTWNSLPLPIACDLFATQKPPYIYEIPTLCTLGVRPAILSFMNSRKTWSKQPGSSWVASGRPGRQLHPLVPCRSTRNSPAGGGGPPGAHCIFRDKLWTRPHRGCDLLHIRLRRARCWHLSVGESRDEY